MISANFALLCINKQATRDQIQCQILAFSSQPLLNFHLCLDRFGGSSESPLNSTEGPGLIQVIQHRRERNKQQGFLLFQIFTEGCSVLVFPLCRVRSSKRNFLEIIQPLKALPGYPHTAGPTHCWLWEAPGGFKVEHIPLLKGHTALQTLHINLGPRTYEYF